MISLSGARRGARRVVRHLSLESGWTLIPNQSRQVVGIFTNPVSVLMQDWKPLKKLCDTHIVART